MIQKLQNAGKFITTSGSGYIPPSRDIIPNKKLPTAATINQWLKGTFSYITGIKDSDLIESKYRPSKETNTTTKYYTRKGLDYDVMRNLLGGKESSAKTFEGEPLYYKNFNDLYNRLSNKTYRKGRQLRTTDNSHLGEYTIGIGEDNNGRYVSYYDKFDWAPNEKLEIFFPYEIYNRIYEKDFNRMQKELNNETYSGSNPSGNWFFKSGINNKGYFKFGGKTANARKWKHEDGGEIKYSDPLRRIIKKHQTGGKTTFGQKVGNFLNSQAGQTIVNGALSLINTSADNKKIQADVEAQKAQNQADWAQTMKQIIKQNQQERNQQYQQWVNDYQSGRTMDQPSQIVSQHMGYEQLNQELAEGKQGLTNKNNQLDAQANAETSSNRGNAIGGILQSGLGVVGDYLSSKGTTPVTTGSSVYKVDSFWTNPTLKTSTPTYSFNTPTLTPPKTNYSFLK